MSEPNFSPDALTHLDALPDFSMTIKGVMVEVEVEEYDEWRLSGRPDDETWYDFTGNTPENIDAVRAIWAKIQSGERPWTDAKLTRRHVTITRTPWTDADPAAPGE